MVQESAATASALDIRKFEDAYRQLLSDSSIQLELTAHVAPETPAWLRSLGELLVAIWPAVKVLWWVALFALGLFLLYLFSGRLLGLNFHWRRRSREDEGAGDSWLPAEAPARELLREADELAAGGRFSEAAHLLLFRSIEDINSRRPDLVRPALTSRDIASAPDIPAGPKSAFTTIVMLVERSLFGGQELGQPEWRTCRTAYEGFAFAQDWS